MEDTIARGRGLSGDLGGNGGDRFGALGCSRLDEEDPYMDVEGRQFGLRSAKSPLRLERGLPLSMGGGKMLSGDSTRAAISIPCPKTSAFKSTFRPASGDRTGKQVLQDNGGLKAPPSNEPFNIAHK